MHALMEHFGNLIPHCTARSGVWRAAILSLGLAAWGAWAASAPAAMVTLTDLNSSVTFETQAQNGMYNWLVDGVDQMAQQWFWYRIGTSGPEASIDTLQHDPLVDMIVSDGNFNPGDDQLALRYTDQLGRFQIIINYTLNGGQLGSGVSDVIETITIQSLRTTGSLNFHFFQYSDFDLRGDALDESVAVINANTVQQIDGVALSETIASPAPTRYEVNYFSNILDALNDGLATNLSNNAGPITNGDLTWAFQWSFVLPAGGSFIISKDKRIGIVPEPSSLALGGIGAVALVLTARRVRRRR